MTLRRVFGVVRRRAAKRFPELAGVRFRRCRAADREHAKSSRQYMHVGHHDGVVCYAAATHELGLNNQVGLVVHELGHMVGYLTLGDDHTEEHAQRLGADACGIPVEYRGRKRLEWSPVGAKLRKELR